MTRRLLVALWVCGAAVAASVPVVVGVATRSFGWACAAVFVVVSAGVVTASLARRPGYRQAALAAITGIIALIIGCGALLAYAFHGAKP